MPMTIRDMLAGQSFGCCSTPQSMKAETTEVEAGGPGSGRHKTSFALTTKATRNQVADVLGKAGYSRDRSKSNIGTFYNHPDGHTAQHISTFKTNAVKVYAVGPNPEEHFSDVEMALDEAKLKA